MSTDKRNRLAFNVAKPLGALYLWAAEKALTKFDMTVNFGEDSLDMIEEVHKVMSAVDNLLVQSNKTVRFDPSNRMGGLLADTNLGPLIKKHQKFMDFSIEDKGNPYHTR